VQVYTVEMHQVESPQDEIVLNATVNLGMQGLEAVRVHGSASMTAEPQASEASEPARCGKRSVQSAPLRV
jgi:hypothetical protein